MFSFAKSYNFSGDSKYDVVAVGEVLLDIISKDSVDSFKEVDEFKRYFGGSPANIAMNLVKLGAKSALISKVGQDGLGEYVLERLQTRGVNVDGVVIDPNAKTSIILVTKSQASPQFLAYRDADKRLMAKDIAVDLIKDAKLVHLSTFALSALQSREALLRVIDVAKEYNKIISLDPNYRAKLWEGKSDGQEFVKNLLQDINIIKPSLDDAAALFGTNNPRGYIKDFHQAGVELVILTLGAQGVMVSDGDQIIELESYAQEVIDTTGAGDAFWSGLYAALVTDEKLDLAVKVGNATAALALKEIGALTDLPSKEQIIKDFKLI